MNLLERFTRKYAVNLKTKCWEWTACRKIDGYGTFALDGYHTINANRASYIMFKGEIPAGMLVCHSCDNPGCVNPDHLWLGTHQDNADDCWKKGRHAFQKEGAVSPRLGTGALIGDYISTTCVRCGNKARQHRSNAARGARPTCSMACKHKLMEEGQRRARARMKNVQP